MAVIDPVAGTGRKPIAGDGENNTVQWAGMSSADTASADSALRDFNDKSVQVEGTFAGGTSVSLKGSIDGTNYQILRDPQGNVLTFTAAGLKSVQEAVPFIKPTVASGVADSVTITVFGKRNK